MLSLHCIVNRWGGVPFEVFVQIPPQIVKPSQALRELATQIWPKLANTVNPVHLPVPISVCNCLQGGLHRQTGSPSDFGKQVGWGTCCMCFFSENFILRFGQNWLKYWPVPISCHQCPQLSFLVFPVRGELLYKNTGLILIVCTIIRITGSPGSDLATTVSNVVNRRKL